MILPESRSLAWIEETAKNNNAKDITLVEKTIRAFSLLEALARSGMEFCFKGGSCLLLHLGSARRMSIDVDVICPPGTEIEKYLEKYSDEYGFSSVEPDFQDSEFYEVIAFRPGYAGSERALGLMNLIEKLDSTRYTAGFCTLPSSCTQHILPNRLQAPSLRY